MERLVPLSDLCAVIAPFYPKGEGGRPAVGLSRMLRIYFQQQWFNLSDPAVEEAIYDSAAMRRFVGIDLGREAAPDETAILRFRHLPEKHHLGRKLFEEVHRHLEAQGLKVARGTIVDATIIAAPSSTRNQDRKRDPDMLHGEETGVWGDRACQGQTKVIKQCAPRAQDMTHRRCRRKGEVDEIERAKNRNRSRVRAKVEHAFGVIKNIFGFVKVRYKGLMKNASRLFATCALANLYLARHQLLQHQGAGCAQ